MDPLEFRFINAYRDGDMKAHRQPTEGAALIECMQEASRRRQLAGGGKVPGDVVLREGSLRWRSGADAASPRSTIRPA